MPPVYSQPPAGPDNEPGAEPSSGPDGPIPSTGSSSDSATADVAGSTNEPFEERLWKAVASRGDRNVVDVVLAELQRLRAVHELPDELLLLALYEPRQGIASWQADRLVSAAKAGNPQRNKDILLILRNGGGPITPAYQIAKILKSLSNARFVVGVPREAKSAATLIALGADEIHMGLLGELGPIDPQIGNLPALGVKRALETLASLAQSPGSSEMFANYLARTVRIDQIGYYERVAESAVQYAERLLRSKPALVKRANDIAKLLVYEYKDHGFVIDSDEATNEPLGLGQMIVTGSAIASYCEAVHDVLEQANLFLWVHRPRRRLQLVGDLVEGLWITPDEASSSEAT